MSSEFAVQKAIYDALVALGLTVHDMAPQAADGGSDASWPYVEVGQIVPAVWDTSRETGFDVAARIHVRSRSGEMRETREIQGRIYDRLHRGDLVVPLHNTILIDRQLSEVMRAPDGTFHGICTYRVLIEKV